MLISFIIPHYNLPEKELHRCLDSIAAQGLQQEEYEILLVDDGSDKQPTWSAGTASLPNKRLLQGSHGGPGAARNLGLNEAQGEYIQFIDADDALAAGSFARCTEIIKNERPDILRHQYRVYSPDSTPTGNENKKAEKRELYDSGADYMARNNLNGSPCAYIFRREIANKHNIRFTEKVMHEDEDFNLKIHYYAKKLIQTNLTVYHYHIRPGSITASSDHMHELKRISDLFALLERVTRFRYEQQEHCTTTEQRALNHKTTMLTVDTLRNLFYHGFSDEEIEELCYKRLSPLGLYPLPSATYSMKYVIFRLLANSSTGIRILRTILPSRKPQKR